jgi:hypothetical protein
MEANVDFLPGVLSGSDLALGKENGALESSASEVVGRDVESGCEVSCWVKRTGRSLRWYRVFLGDWMITCSR